jgi:hypothetical protein
MATTLTKKGWFGKTSGAWSKTGSNTVVDTVDGIKLNAQLHATFPHQVLPNTSLDPISTGDGYLTLTGDASKKVNSQNFWSNAGILNRGVLVVGNGGCNIIGTGGTGISSSTMMFFGDGNNTITGNGGIGTSNPVPQYATILTATGISNHGSIQFGNGNNTLTGNGSKKIVNPELQSSNGNSFGNGYTGMYNLGDITFGNGNNTVNALQGGFDGDGYIEFGSGENTIKGFGQMSIDGGDNAQTKLLLNPGTYQIIANGTGGSYVPFQITQTGAWSQSNGQYSKMDITGIPLIGAASGANPLSLKQGTYTVDSKGKITYDSLIGNDAYMVYDPSTHTSTDLFVDSNLNGGTYDPTTGKWIYPTHEVRFASTTAGKKLTLFAEDTGAGRVVIGTGTAARAITTGKTALDVDASLVKQALTLQGNNGNNKITGGSGDDIFISSAGTDTLNGGSGSNTVDYSANPNSIMFTYGDKTINKGGTRGTDTLISIQNIIATSKNDTIAGDTNNNVITGGLGTDIMDGKNGSDTYVVNSGAEHTAAEIKDTGTDGTDTVQFNSTITNDKLILFAGDTGIEAVSIGAVGISHYMPQDGSTGTGTTALNIDASAVLNRLTIKGNDGDNIILGSKLDNIIYGGNGIDTINGGDGNDTIFGGLGNDILTGGNGKDAFVFDAMPNSTTNRDLITDFASGSDSLCFMQYGRTWDPVLQNRLFNPLLLDNSTYDQVSGTYGIDNKQFMSGAGVSQATTADQRFLYDTTSGILSYDRDGSASAYGLIQVAVLGTSTHPGLVSTDFRVK